MYILDTSMGLIVGGPEMCELVAPGILVILATRENRHVMMVFGATDCPHDHSRVALISDHIDLTRLTAGQI